MLIFHANQVDSLKSKKQIKHFVCAVKWKLTVNFPKFGFCFPAKIFNAVDFPIPLVPTKPSTSPGRGMGNLIVQIYVDNHLHNLCKFNVPKLIPTITSNSKNHKVNSTGNM